MKQLSDELRQEHEAALMDEIRTLSERVWETRIRGPQIEDWLSNFGKGSSPDDGVLERLHALYILSRFLYFGTQEIRAMLKSLYRERYKYPIVEQIRRGFYETKNLEYIESLFQEALTRTRFVGVGEPSESGHYILYPFRQENQLPKGLFISPHQILKKGSEIAQNVKPATEAEGSTADSEACSHCGRKIEDSLVLQWPEVNRYVFVDDFCGSGQQAEEFAKNLIADMRTAAANDNISVYIAYFVLVGTNKGLDRVRKAGFDEVGAVLELDESFKCFDDKSRYFRDRPDWVSSKFAEAMCYYYGSDLYPGGPLGWENSQLLIGFSHNTPDNTLPVIWFEDDGWQPIFRRYGKKKGTPLYGS